MALTSEQTYPQNIPLTHSLPRSSINSEYSFQGVFWMLDAQMGGGERKRGQLACPPPKGASPPKGAPTHPGHQGALQKALQELGDGALHAAAPGWSAGLLGEHKEGTKAGSRQELLGGEQCQAHLSSPWVGERAKEARWVPSLGGRWPRAGPGAGAGQGPKEKGQDPAPAPPMAARH